MLSSSLPERWVSLHVGLELLAVLLVLAGSLFSLLFFIEGRQLEDQRMKTHFTEAAHARVSLLEKEIEIHGEHIESIAAFYDGSVKVERAEFGKFVEGPLFKHPDAVAFLWVPRVTAAQRDAYELWAREDGLADFRIYELDSSGHHIAASSREVYFPIYFLQPYEGNELIAGLDLASFSSHPSSFQRQRSVCRVPQWSNCRHS